jgi:ketosteroid isomerase-like protein
MRYFDSLSLVLASGFFFPIPHPQKSLQTPSLPVRQYVSDMRTKNIDDVLQLYSKDAVVVDPNGTRFSTPDELRNLYQKTFSTYDAEIALNRTSLRVKGDPNSAGSTAVESDDYRENLLARQSKTMQVVCGTTVSNWVRTDDDRWLITNQAWTAKPCAAETAQ